MFFYEVGYGSYEDSGYIQLFHKKEFSEEEFEALILEVAPEAAERSLERQESLEDETQKGDYYRGHRFEDMYPHIAALLIEKHGFREISYCARYSVFGWPNLLDKSDWGSDRDETLTRLTDRLNAAGFTPEKYPTHEDREYRTWAELDEETRERWALMGYDEGSFNDAWDDSIPDEEKRKPVRKPRKRSRRKAVQGEALPPEDTPEV